MGWTGLIQAAGWHSAGNGALSRAPACHANVAGSLPCARDRVPSVVATSFLVLTMQGASVWRTRCDVAGCSAC